MAEGTIDKLQIVVTADTKQAETALEKLQKSLQPLADLTKKIGARSLRSRQAALLRAWRK